MNKMEIRRICTFLIVIGIISLGISSISNVATSSGKGSWITKTSMPTARVLAGAAVVGGKIYVIGGYKEGSGMLNANEMYDPTTNSWTIKSPMPTARCAFGIAMVNGKIYVIGGDTKGGTLGVQGNWPGIETNIIEVYDTTTDTWDNSFTPMPTSRFGLSCGSVNEKIYAIGGEVSDYPSNTQLDTCEVYDPSSDSWSSLPPMPTSRSFLATGVIDEKIYAVGGEQYGDRCECFDPDVLSWDTLQPPPVYGSTYNHHRRGACTAVVNEKLYIFGGLTDTEDNLNYCDEYNPSINNWSTMTNMPTARYGAIASTVNEKIYVIGGEDWPRQYLTKNEEFTPPSGNNPPAVDITFPSEEAVITATITITGNALDTDGTVQHVQLRIDSGSWIAVSGNISWRYSWDTTTVSNGDHTISTRSYDGEDYSDVKSIGVTVDNPTSPENQRPTITISNPDDGDTVSGTITIRGTADDSDGTVQSVQIKIDFGSWSTVSGTTSWSCNWDTTSVNNGDHTISTRSYDGEDYSDVESVDVYVDNKDNGTPGFELVIVIVALGLILLWKRK